MEIAAAPDQWAVNDEQNWAAFLATETGKRFYNKFISYVPPLLTSGETNAILIRTGEVNGFRLALNALQDMVQGPPPGATTDAGTNYPAPEDDSKWNDGQKLQVETEPAANNV